nr:F-box protein At3g07870-like [Quercus suber]
MFRKREPPILQQKNYVPHDIVLNILTRLPVKSLLRFRCICKSYYSSITTPNFISSHLNNTNNNKDHGTPFDFPSGRAKIVGSYNGLLCLADIESTTTFGNVIYLWNPSIRKFKRLPKPCLGQLDSVTLGFAYHSENNDYKVVRISISHSVPPSEIEVYTLSSDSWRRIEMPLRSNIKFYDNNYFLPIPLVSGALHWMAGFIDEEEKHSSEMIMCFDVNCEKFRNLEMPDGSMSVPSFQICLASFKGKLAVITYGESEQYYQYTIWVMREYGVHESWHKPFVLPFGGRVAICIGFTENGSLLICRRNDQLENKKYKFVLVDNETLREKDFDIQHASCVGTFMESLALLDGANMRIVAEKQGYLQVYEQLGLERESVVVKVLLLLLIAAANPSPLSKVLIYEISQNFQNRRNCMIYNIGSIHQTAQIALRPLNGLKPLM